MHRQRVRTRIAPSPTGFLHLGTARTALYLVGLRAPPRRRASSCASRTPTSRARRRSRSTRSSRRCTGSASTTTKARSTRCSASTATARWSRRCSPTARAYRCYCTPAELEAMREAQRARGEKPRYDGRWRPEPGKTLPPVPDGVQPVVRFRNPHRRRRDLGRPGQGPDHASRNRRDRRPGHRRAPTACRPTTSRRRRRLGHAHHARVPRRRARQQHAVADQHLPRARRAAAAVRPRADDPGRRRRRSCRSATARSA